MTVADRGRFCASCQKSVIDFTQSSDTHIAEVFKKEGDVCGRFLKSQLERDLVIPKEKNRLWMAASAAIVAFLGLGYSKVFAQTEIAETVQVEKDIVTSNTAPTGTVRVITGTVTDETGLIIPGVNVVSLNSGTSVLTDSEGIFSIEVGNADILEFSFVSMKKINVELDHRNDYSITMFSDFIMEDVEMVVFGHPTHTFFGSIFHRIGNIFRKKGG
ncbi:carboxypeptidase-like regulatory domain-containing protein [Flavobacterium rivuli]|nr:carboxypeptidase-like regulatory domain-containing protein [Flavobacterium rivuli]